MSDSTYKILIGQPNAGSIMPCCVTSLGWASKKYTPQLNPHQFGALVHNFNILWCEALNGRKTKGYTHFAMIHSDIQAAPHWLDTLIEEMDRVDAEVMSTIIAIKDKRGLTTTGLRYPGQWGTKRYTMREIMGMPETFSIEDTEAPDAWLAINTGLWVCRLNPWVEKFPGFSNKYKVTISESGEAVPWFDSEDWRFSDWLARHKIRTFATRKPEAYHVGAEHYGNATAWGEWLTDITAPTRPLDRRITELPDPGITIETEHPVAVESLDHTKPLGAIQDNSVSLPFNRKLFELIPAVGVRLLDLGCSGGGLVRSILEAGGFAVGIEGSDISLKGGRAEWSKIPAWLFTADATEPFQLRNGAPLRFNVITGWEFLEHIPTDKLEAVVANIRRHATPDALFVGSISPSVEPHHMTAQPKWWWLRRLGGLGITYRQDLVDHFGGDLVRGWHTPPRPECSFSFAGTICVP